MDEREATDKEKQKTGEGRVCAAQHSNVAI